MVLYAVKRHLIASRPGRSHVHNQAGGDLIGPIIARIAAFKVEHLETNMRLIKTTLRSNVAKGRQMSSHTGEAWIVTMFMGEITTVSGIDGWMPGGINIAIRTSCDV